MKRIIFGIGAFVFLSGFAGFFDCWKIDLIGRYRIDECQNGNIDFSSARPRKWYPPNIMYDEQLRYTFNDPYIYVYSIPFDSFISEVSWQENGKYNFEVDEELRTLEKGHPDRQTRYVKINQKVGKIIYFRKKNEMDELSQRIFSRLEEVYELEKEGKWERKINHHNVSGFKKWKMKYWDSIYEYPKERIDMEDLFSSL